MVSIKAAMEGSLHETKYTEKSLNLKHQNEQLQPELKRLKAPFCMLLLWSSFNNASSNKAINDELTHALIKFVDIFAYQLFSYKKIYLQ